MALRLPLGLALATMISAAAAESLVVRAEGGDSKAIDELCFAYSYGEGMDQDYEAAFHWCEIGAKSGSSNAQVLFAELYRFGYGVDADIATARRWYLTAAEQTHIHAQFMLGQLAVVEPDVEGGLGEACKWLRIAAGRKYEPAEIVLAKLEEMWAEAPENPAGVPLCSGPNAAFGPDANGEAG